MKLVWSTAKPPVESHHTISVSVIIPVYNSMLFLERAVFGVVNQTLTDVEVIIIDDGSSDGSGSRASELASMDDRLTVISNHSRRGAAAARNMGIRLARGRFIAFCDSDDFWFEEKLERQVSFMKETHCSVSFTGFRKIAANKRGSRSRDRVVRPPSRVDYAVLLRSNPIGLSTAMYDTRRCGKVYMPDIARRQDYGLWFRIMKDGHVGLGLKEPLVEYRVRRGSLSSNKVMAAWYTWRVLREVAGLSVPRAALSFTSYLRESLRKARI